MGALDSLRLTSDRAPLKSQSVGQHPSQATVKPYAASIYPLSSHYLRAFLHCCWLVVAALNLAACAAERAPDVLDAQVARAFYDQNRRADLSAFEGVTVRVTRPVLLRDVTLLGHVYAISFCTEVVDVRGYRDNAELTYYYSDWPPTQHDLMRRARPDSLGRERLGELFQVQAADAPATFAKWAGELVVKLKKLNPPWGPANANRDILTLRACVSKEGHPVGLKLASGVEIFYLPADTENSLYWTKERRELQRLGPNWYWRRPPATEIKEDNPAGTR